MRKLLTAIVVLLCFLFSAKAQYVNIPDSNFRNFLIMKYPSCFNSSKKMNTTCSIITYENSLIIPPGLNITSIYGIQYFINLSNLNCNNNQLTSLPALPNSLEILNCNNNQLTSLPALPNTLLVLNFDNNKLSSLPTLPNSIIELNCSNNYLTSLPILPNNLLSLSCNYNLLNNLPVLPDSLKNFDCAINKLTSLPTLPLNLQNIQCSGNLLTSLPSFPISLQRVSCHSNKLTILPNMPNSLIWLNCFDNQLTVLPPLSNKLSYLNCSYNQLSSLPVLVDSIKFLFISKNFISCLPKLPSGLQNLTADFDAKIFCIPNYFSGYNDSLHPFLCDPTNNINHCQSFPVIKSFAFTDFNNNNKLDLNEYVKNSLKLSLSNNNYTYTNTQGVAYINADTLGTYTITATPPPFYNAVPASYTHTFNTYDTIVYDTFALQPTILKDSIAIKLTPTNWAARPGFKYPYLVSYENVGTTVLSNANVGLKYDNSLLVYDSSSNHTVVNSGSNLSVNIGNIVPGQTGSFITYFTVKPATTLGSSITSITSITTNTVAAYDTITTIARGSYDPNDKQATPSLTTQQVTEGRFIDYTIRFQNTGSDTAFNVVIADTLDSKLIANQVQMVGSSHNCKTTIKDNIIFFEFLDILLPDSNTNKVGSNGFVSFKIQPVSSVVSGTTIPNKAAIYFDYNSPVITKPANTIIQNPLPVKLLSFSAIAQKETNNILVYWNTANEVNTSHFIIEQSLNGKDFKPAAEVAAKGTGSNNYYYSIDKNNVVYIRLKMVDKNGQFSYSNIIKLSIEKATGFEIVNNPAANNLYLKINAASLQNTFAKLINTQGQTVKTFTLKQGYQTIDITTIPSGLYYLQTALGATKIIIQQ